MNGLENIIKKIKAEQLKELEKLKAENRINCEKIINDTTAKIEYDRKQAKEKIEQEILKIEKKAKTENAVFEKKTIAKKKQSLASKAIHFAFETFREQRQLDYFKLLEKLIFKNLPNQKFTILIGNCDYEKFKEYISKVFSIEHSYFEKVEISYEFNYGAKVISKNYNVNLTLENIISEFDDILRPLAFKKLFAGD